MSSYILIQEDLLERVQKAFINYKKAPKERITVSFIETRLETLEKWWNTYEENHRTIVSEFEKAKRSQQDYFTKDWYGKFEEIYLEFNIRMKEDLRKFTNLNKTSAVTSGVEVKLPQIQLPKFGGNYEEWQTFHDMFLSLIHTNNTLTPVQKLHYLKTSLFDEAALILKNISITENNYDEAWKQLTRRYTNKRFNCNEIMKRLFGQRVLVAESASGIKNLLDNTSACLKSLENLTIDISSWDAIINHLVLTKVDAETRKQWEFQVSRSDSDDMPTWNQLCDFLETRFRTLELLDGIKTTQRFPMSNNSTKQVATKKVAHSAVIERQKINNKEKICVMCEGSHAIYQCEKFEKLSPEQRTEFVKSNGMCFNCLLSNHSVKSCNNPMCCRRCGRRHHQLLHYEKVLNRMSSASTSIASNFQNSDNKVATTQSRDQEKKVVAHFASEQNERGVLLATSMIRVRSSSGKSSIVRALIDQGSEASFVTENIVQVLGLKKTHVQGVISGIGEGQAKTKSKVSVMVESLITPEFCINVNAFVLKRLTSFIPSRRVSIADWPEIENFSLADPNFGSPGRIDVILGADIYGIVIREGLLRHSSLDGPIAQNTSLGWILSGKAKIDYSVEQPLISCHVKVEDEFNLKQFWEIEREPDSIEKKKNKEELRCEEIFEKTTVRDEFGRYVVRLPFKSAYPECLEGKSVKIAATRLKYLEKRLCKDDQLYDEYRKGMLDYELQQHLVKIVDPKLIEDDQAVYLPHHAVVRPDKETTKVRIVFDASSKGINNVSLNDSLLVGPKLQSDLRHLLLRWRHHEICIIADLKQMYRQIKVDDRDADFQRVLWRSEPNKIMEHYKMLRLTFGTACAPYLAVKSLQQLAKDEQDLYPKASQITLTDFYMDDLLTGCEKVEDAMEIYNQLNNLMSAGGFELQKWSSNSKEFLEYIKKDCQQEDASVVLRQSEMIKVLGIAWNKLTDDFEYILKLPEKSDTMTKRQVLSNVARLYDPIGWIAPVIFRAKVFIQCLWKSGLNWDDIITDNLLRKWHEYSDDLKHVREIFIPRWLQTKRNDSIELHVFSDASQVGYAAAVYLKSRDTQGNIRVYLITSKTKVAPVEKEISIPRMELCGALLATKLILEVSQVMKVPRTNLHAWTDSTVVLAWIAGEPSRWTNFVSNRVSEILTVLDRNQWSHVSGVDNPADCASRGSSAKELKDNSLWWYGPKWLHQDDYYSEECNSFKTCEEERPRKCLIVTIPTETFIWLRFSELGKMLRVLAYCRRVLQLKIPASKRIKFTKTVTAKEKDEILKECIRQTQELHFKEEIAQIKIRGETTSKGKLRTLSPYFDEDKILRVGGRINEAYIDSEKKHPIILPSTSHITKLIILDVHMKSLHGGPQIMLNLIRSKYWIIRARDLVKKCYRACTTCLRYTRQKTNPYMGDLPLSRLKPIRPFKISGVDFTGHINMRLSRGRGSKSYKGYICVFVCMFSKAMHLEAVSDLSSQGFIAAFKRFVSRRGHCETLYSDNGTNFVGASKELGKMFDRGTSQVPDEISGILANDGTTWSFIPPHAPNFGGLWEAGVRSVKGHLRRVIGDSTLTYEELSTVLTQIEACLNSRPLSQVSNNPEDPMPLTPGHLLVGEPLIILPDENFDNKNISSFQRWKFTQKMVTDFWKKWSDEYLVTLNQRYKWNKKTVDPDIDDVVIIRDHNLPPAKWLLGKIVKKYPGKDNITRVVKIKTKNGLCKRPCNKLCFLPNSETVQ